MLSDCLEEFDQLSSAKIKNATATNSEETEIKPLCSFAQEEQLKVFIEKLENMFNSNEVNNLKKILNFYINIIIWFYFVQY